MLTSADAAVLGSGKWFAGLPPEAADALLRLAVVVRLEAGALLFARGDANDGIYGTLQGTLRFGSSTASGREIVFAFAQPPQWFGEVSMFSGRRTHDAWAESDARLAYVRRADLSKLLADEPLLWKHLGQLACHKLEVAFEALESSAPGGRRRSAWRSCSSPFRRDIDNARTARSSSCKFPRSAWRRSFRSAARRSTSSWASSSGKKRSASRAEASGSSIRIG